MELTAKKGVKKPSKKVLAATQTLVDASATTERFLKIDQLSDKEEITNWTEITAKAKVPATPAVYEGVTVVNGVVARLSEVAVSVAVFEATPVAYSRPADTASDTAKKLWAAHQQLVDDGDTVLVLLRA